MGSIDLTFGPSVTRESIHIAVLDDEVVEEDETFVVILSSSSSGVELDPATAIVNITDDDSDGKYCYHSNLNELD